MNRRQVNVSRSGNRGRPNNRSSNSAVVTRAQLRRENHLIENGQKLSPLPHPTDFMAIPWFPLTVQLNGVSSLSMSNVDSGLIRSLPIALRAQLGLPQTFQINIRIQSIRVWGPLIPMNAATSLLPLRCVFYSLVLPPSTVVANVILEDIISYPDQVSRASLGFVYPKAQQALVLLDPGSVSFPIMNVTVGGATNNVVYVRLLWRPYPPAPDVDIV